MNDKDLIIDDVDNTVIDLSGYSAGQDTISFPSSFGTDTITITGGGSSGMNYSSVNTIVPPTTYSIGTGINSTGINWSSTYSTLNTNSTVNINTDGIEMAPGTDIKVDGKSLKEFMSKMEQRMAILVPDPVKLEKFEALKKAYEHYKTMESLCFDEPKEEQE